MATVLMWRRLSSGDRRSVFFTSLKRRAYQALTLYLLTLLQQGAPLFYAASVLTHSEANDDEIAFPNAKPCGANRDRQQLGKSFELKQSGSDLRWSRLVRPFCGLAKVDRVVSMPPIGSSFLG